MKLLRSAEPSGAPARLNTSTVEFTTSTRSVRPGAMSSLGGVTSWSTPKLWIVLACPVPAKLARSSGEIDAPTRGFTGPAGASTTVPDGSELPRSVTWRLPPRRNEWLAAAARSAFVGGRNGTDRGEIAAGAAVCVTAAVTVVDPNIGRAAIRPAPVIQRRSRFRVFTTPLCRLVHLPHPSVTRKAPAAGTRPPRSRLTGTSPRDRWRR